ncbi:MAG: PD-(D/E)XK nuclease family protein [Bacteroidales bacterium]|nr:PD-(D/E)XK nuclease family protein [Bacteroidales bacterium]
MTEIDKFRQILSEFDSTPKINTNPTFMDICQLGGDKFEERCSQILRFYLDPNGPHNLKSLLLNSLLEAAQKSDTCFSPAKTKVITEEMTEEGKYIDITVISDSMVIAIENKIGASLYNPLDNYARHINRNYPDKEVKIFIVLSAKRIYDSAEIQKIKENDYIYINYSSFFTAIKRNLGNYALDADQAYLTFLLDFIRTIENRFYHRNMELKNFFYENRKHIENLLHHYDNFKNEIHQIRKEQISQYKTLICSKTGAEWWIYQGWDLGISFNDKTHRIGIESSFSNGTFENPLGMFHIYITVWRKSHFFTYEQQLKQKYPNSHIDYNAINGTRVFLHIAILPPDKPETIISTLAETYNTLKSIVDKHNAAETESKQ